MNKTTLLLFSLLITIISCTQSDNPLIFVSDFTIKMDENPNNNQSIGFIKATTSKRTITYSLIDQLPNNALSINSTTGELKVLNSYLFDFEVNPVIKATVKVENGIVSETVKISITLNDLVVEAISTSDFTIKMDENPTNNQSIGFIKAITNQGTITYSLVNQLPNNALSINSTTGELKVLNSSLFNFEVNPTISATVKLENGNVTKTANVVITLNDVIEINLQDRLNNGETPYQIYQSDNSLLNSIYGLTYKGGIIFYLNTTNGTGMVTAATDQSTGINWGCMGTNITNAENSGIGYGNSNTNAIVALCNQSSYAAKLCYDLNLNGYTDWFLPSKDELNLMYLNLKSNGLGNFSNSYYWTSTEFNDNSSGNEAVWVQYFTNGIQITYDYGIKSFNNRVRAVRNF